MSVAEKLQAIETRWDVVRGDDIELPKWHHDELSENDIAKDSHS